MRRLALPALACAAALAGGCGVSTDDEVDPNDKRAVTLECLTEEKGLDARPMGRNAIQVGDPATGPRIRFFLTNGEAEAEQFKGRFEGSEQIETALLFVRRGSEETLEEVEKCLDDL
jgi:hypothetical protein